MNTQLKNKLQDCENELDEIEELLGKIPVWNKERLYLTNYALIKVSGTIELVYRSIVADHFTQLSNEKINNYLDKNIRNGSMGAQYEKMVELLGKFDEQWAENFKNRVKERTDKDRLISATKSLTTSRNAFAHGNLSTATFSDIKQYYNDAIILINIFDSIVI